MTDKEVQDFQREWEKLMSSYYLLGYSRFRKALRESIKPVLRLLEESGSIGLAQVMSQMLVTEIPMASAISDFQGTITDRTARFLFNYYKKFIPESVSLGVGFGSEIFAMNMRQWIATEGLQNVREITDTTKKRLAKAFEDGVAEGDTIRQLGKRIDDYVLGGLDGGRINKRARALLISRTETLLGMGKARELQMASYGVDFDKVWLHSAGVKNPREPHAMANNSRRDYDGVWNFYGASMRYAGDSRGGAKNNCNCSCSTIYKPKRDKQGNLIRR